MSSEVATHFFQEPMRWFCIETKALLGILWYGLVTIGHSRFGVQRIPFHAERSNISSIEVQQGFEDPISKFQSKVAAKRIRITATAGTLPSDQCVLATLAHFHFVVLNSTWRCHEVH